MNIHQQNIKDYIGKSVYFIYALQPPRITYRTVLSVGVEDFKYSAFGKTFFTVLDKCVYNNKDIVDVTIKSHRRYSIKDEPYIVQHNTIQFIDNSYIQSEFVSTDQRILNKICNVYICMTSIISEDYPTIIQYLFR